MNPFLNHRRIVAVLTIVMAFAASLAPVHAHSLDTRSTSIQFADDYVLLMSQRATLGQPLLQDGDEFWILLKTTPGPGTPTGVGGYQTFYVPDGAKIIDVGYVLPDTSDPRGFREIPMKGQSAIAIGSGSAGASSTPELIGWELPGVNGLGIKSAPVTAAGVDRGTIAGMYADTGVFYSTDPRTEFNSYGTLKPPLTGGPSAMVNNSGDTVGEYWAANVADSQNLGILGVMTMWDAQQLRAYGSKTPGAPILDTQDGRGNLPWGLGNAVAGPQSGYAWEFDLDTYNSTVGTHAQKMRAAIKIGPWHRIKYPGSQISSDTPGLVSSVIGNVGIDASTLGIEPGNIPDDVKAIRFAIGQIELGRPEYSAVKIKVKDGFAPNLCGHLDLYGDAFGGDAGGTSGGKDHIWRYFDPTVHTLNPCALLQKTVSKTLVAPGETFHYTITFANNGTTPLLNVSVVDTLPTGIVHVSATPSPTTSAAPTYTWNLGTVAPGAIVTITQYVRATGTGTLYNTATAYSGTQVVGRAQQSVEVGTRAVLLKEKSVTPSTAQPGGSVQYTLTVENVGTGPNGVPMVVRDYLPPGFTYGSFVSATLNGAAIASPTITANSSTPAVPYFTVTQAIQPGKKLIIKFNASIGAGVTPGTYWNQFEVDYEGKRISPIPEAPVVIGGGQIGDFVWRDWNGNGIQDPGEEGLPGVTMRLYAADGTTLLQTKVTESNGSYLFSGLDVGTYVVKVHSGVPAGYTLTGDPDNTPDGEHTINLAFNQTYSTADFGYRPSGTGSIGDQIFQDVGNDGVYNAGTDTGIGGVTVSLYKDSNNDGVYTAGVDPLVATTTSNGGGIYTFSGLPQGFSYLALVNAGDSALATHFGVDPYQASTPNPRVITNLSGAYVDADFGFWKVQPATIGDQVFLDANGNGIYDAGDSPLANVTVTLLRNNAPIATTVSGPDGIYLFTNLGPGTYTVAVDTADTDIPAGYAPTIASHNVTVSAGQSHLTADFPFVSVFSKVVNKSYAPPGDALTYTITPKWPGSGALSNVQVRDPIPAGTTFGSAGQGGSNNSGTVTWNLGSTTAATNGSKNMSSGGGNITNIASATNGVRPGTNVTVVKPTGTAQNDVMIASVSWQNGTNATPSAPVGWTQIGTTANSGNSHGSAVYYRVAGASEGTNYTFALSTSQRFSVGISTYRGVDTNSPINAHGVQVNAASTNATAPSITTTVTNTRLVAVFAHKGGSSTSFTSPGGMTQRFYVSSQAGGAMEAGNVLADQAQASAGATGTRVGILGSSIINIGHLIALAPASVPSYDTVTALSANRSLVTSGDTLTVTVTLTATGTNIPSTISAPTLNVSGTGGASATFGAASPAGPQSLTSGVPVVFTYTSTSVTAGANAGGVLTFKATPSDANGAWAEGTANTTLVTPPLTWIANVISPNPGVNVVDNVASFYNGPTLLATADAHTAVTASIGDFVWADLDMDGVQDPGEHGLAGVTVRLFASDGTTLLQSAVTDSTGHYRFYGVTPGNYVVSYNGASVPAGYVPTTAVTVPVTLTTGQQFNDADFGLAPLPAGTGSIGDRIWIDANNNGVQDDGELPLANIGLALQKWNGSLWLPVASTVSNAGGFYEFAALPAGTYRVVVDTNSQITSPYASGTFALGSAMAPTFDLDGIGTPNVASVVLPNNSTVVDTLDFGYNWSGTIGDYVWWDDNLNGLQDEAADRGIPHARVQLYFDADGDGVYSALAGDYEIRRVFTNDDGFYFFQNLPPGRYFVDVYEDSFIVDGIRNVVPTTVDVIHRILGPGQSSLDNDFGYFIGARVEANVFWDRNGNGILDSGESLLSGVTVMLGGTDTFGNPVNATADTDSNGNVFFLVPEGNYTISYNLAQANGVYPALGTATTVTSFEFFAAAGEDGFRSFDFGIDNTGAISGTVYGDIDGNGPLDNGDPRLPGVTVNLYLDVNGDGEIDFGAGDLLLAITVTDALGNYSFTGLEDTAGNAKYVVEIATSTLGGTYQTVPTGYPFGADTATSRYGTELTDGSAITGIDFGYPLVPDNYYSVSGVVYNDNGDGGGTASDGIQNGSESGIAGVTVVIQVDADNDSTFEQTFTVITGPAGNYSLGGILEGSNVRVTVNTATLPSSAFGQTGDPDGAPLSNVFDITGIQANRPGLDFGYREVFATVSGTVVKDANGNGIAENGEVPVEGVTVTLIYAGPDNIIGTADDASTQTQTDALGAYSFSGVVPGVYQVVKTNPAGYASQADRDGFDPTIINLTILPGDPLTGIADDKTGQDFEINNRGSISGRVMADLDLNGTGETPLEGVTLTLVDASGNPVLDGGNPVTTVTAADGTYSFTGIEAGNYGVRAASVTGYLYINDADGGDFTHIGDQFDIAVTGGADSPDNDFLVRTQACPNTWEDWKDKWDLDNDTPTGNDDGDIHPNLVEYAFCLDPKSGRGTPYCMAGSLDAVDKVDLVFRRTAGGALDVTYEIEHAATLGAASTAWTTVAIPPANMVVTARTNGTDSVRVTDLEGITGLTAGTGFVRMKVTLRDQDNQVVAAASTDVGGWIQTPLDYEVRSFNDPFLDCPIFTGTITAVEGQDIVTETSGGGVNYNALVTAQPSYAEILTGPLQGHRFDLAGGGVNRFTAVVDNDIYSGTAPFSTAASPQGGLVGAQFVVRPHRTIGSVFPARAFVPTDDPETASVVQMYAGDRWETLWLYNDGGAAESEPAWVAVGDSDLYDRNTDVLVPGQGGFIYSRHATEPGASFMLFGKVRPNDFVRPLRAGLNNVGGGYPLVQSPDGRAMTPTANSFLGDRDFKKADQFLLWRGDARQNLNAGYDTYFMIAGTPSKPLLPNWVLTGDVNLVPQNTILHFKPDYSILLKRNGAAPGNRMPSPWKP